jgi:hypothetical protein
MPQATRFIVSALLLPLFRETPVAAFELKPAVAA